MGQSFSINRTLKIELVNVKVMEQKHSIFAQCNAQFLQ